MRNKRMVLAAALVLLTGFVAASSSQAGRAASRAHHLTVSAPVALPGIVRVRARDTGRALFMAFTESVPRPTSLPADAVITLDEAPVGQAQPITAWFPMGESTGHRFIYR
jgi:hypothetical protein